MPLAVVRTGLISSVVYCGRDFPFLNHPRQMYQANTFVQTQITKIKILQSKAVIGFSQMQVPQKFSTEILAQSFSNSPHHSDKAIQKAQFTPNKCQKIFCQFKGVSNKATNQRAEKLHKKSLKSQLINPQSQRNSFQKFTFSRHKAREQQHNPSNIENRSFFVKRSIDQPFKEAYGSFLSGKTLQGSSRFCPQNNFALNLRRYSEAKQRQCLQNNSPRRNIQGAQRPYEPLKTLNVTMRNFKTLAPLSSKNELKNPEKKNTAKKELSIKLPQLYRTDHQYRLQKEIFYQNHPYLISKENSKSLQRRKDRRSNLIDLQKTYLRVRNKQTSLIFQRQTHYED